MTGICRQPGCPCTTNPAEDEEARPSLPVRPRVGRTMPTGWRERVSAEMAARKRRRTTVDPDATS